MAVSNYDHRGDRFGPGTAYAEPTRGIGSLAKTLIGVAAILGISAFGWVAWVAYDEGVRTGAVKMVPVIKADAGEVKHKPDDPGGMVIPHQDKLVFNRLAPGQSDAPVERLLPQPEAPVALPVRAVSDADAAKSLNTTPETPQTEVATALTPSLVGPVPNEKLKGQDAAPPPVSAAPAPPVDPAEIVAKTPPASGAPLNLPTDATKPAPATPAAAPAAATVEPPAPAVPAAAWRVQLASLSKQTDAEAAWARMQKRNPDLLGALQLQVQAAALSKGTFYRVQAGPLPDRAAADSLCGSLKSRKQDCLVVAP